MSPTAPLGRTSREAAALVQIRPRPLGRTTLVRVTDPLTTELERALDCTRVLSGPLELAAYGSDASFYRLVPRAVVQPRSEAEILSLFAISKLHKVPICFRAAGTSLSGQAITDGILVDLSKHWAGMKVLGKGERIRIQPGAIGGRVNAELQRYGRRIGPDPASIDACMMGGILANNASGMCCGILENAYNTLESIRVILPNGLLLDTSEADCDDRLKIGAPDLHGGLLSLRAQANESEVLKGKIRGKYRIKNTTGYALNALLDFEKPSEILAHLLIGSEGTLGFISSAVLRTLPDYPIKSTALLLFGSSDKAFAAVETFAQSGARAIEFMDYASLCAVSEMPELGVSVKSLSVGVSALLVEYQCASIDGLAEIARDQTQALLSLDVIGVPRFSQDPKVRAGLWKLRKGLFPSVGATKESGETVLIEDIAFPLEKQAKCFNELRAVFAKHGYQDAIVFGHAKDGNCHFVIKQSFNKAEEVARYERFMADIVSLVVANDGSLKAEHGTGRNMAPFVALEWGMQAHRIMQEIKLLVDPAGYLNPGVIINPNPRAHLSNLKDLPTVDPEVDRCIECGFCEPVCPSRRLTLTPRQRIAARREMARLRKRGDSGTLSILERDFQYAGIDTCAADGLCATACPVKIDTGTLIKRLRSEAHSQAAKAFAAAMASNLTWVERTLRFGLRFAHLAERIVGVKPLAWVSGSLERSLATRLPAWSTAFPRVPLKPVPVASLSHPRFIYVPSCLSRIMGQPRSGGSSLIDCILRLSEKAQLRVWLPPETQGTCCGLPFGSKGFPEAHAVVLEKLVADLWRWTKRGRIPVITDASSCLYSIKTSGGILREETREQLSKMRILDLVEFAHDELLPKLPIEKLDRRVVLHPTCAARKLGIDGLMKAIATRCATEVIVPLDLSCCATAGDRGLMYPELTESALAAERSEVLGKGVQGYYSNNLTCEIGMSKAMGVSYSSLIYLVEEAAEQGAYGRKE